MASVNKNLQNFLQDIANKEDYKLCNIDIKPITSGGANYTTDLYLATISQPPKPDIHLFAKVANLNESARTTNEFLASVYETEGLFYTELVTNFERIYKKNNVPAEEWLNIPKYYGHVLTPYEETVVLENLEARGFKNFDRMKTFTWEYAATAVTQLAKYHALCFVFRDESPGEFDKLVSKFINDPMDKPEVMELFMTQMVGTACEAVNDDFKIRLKKYFSAPEFMKVMIEFGHDKTMLIHGDFRPSNLMHRRRNGKLEIIPLDYQTLRMGNPLADLMHFIFSGSDEEFRRLHYQRLLDHYYAELTVALQTLNADVNNFYPRKKFDNDAIWVQPVALCLGLAMAAVVLVAPEDAPKIDGDITSMAVKPSELALERINGIVNDFVRNSFEFTRHYTCFVFYLVAFIPNGRFVKPPD